jgi:hypothetical protein
MEQQVLLIVFWLTLFAMLGKEWKTNMLQKEARNGFGICNSNSVWSHRVIQR